MAQNGPDNKDQVEGNDISALSTLLDGSPDALSEALALAAADTTEAGKEQIEFGGTGDKAMDVAARAETVRIFQSLSPAAQARAYLGSTKPTEMIDRLPEGARIVAIQTPTTELPALRSFLNDTFGSRVKPMNETVFTGRTDSDSGTVTIYGLVTSNESAHALASLISQHRLKAVITNLNPEHTRMLRIQGGFLVFERDAVSAQRQFINPEEFPERADDETKITAAKGRGETVGTFFGGAAQLPTDKLRKIQQESHERPDQAQCSYLVINPMPTVPGEWDEKSERRLRSWLMNIAVQGGNEEDIRVIPHNGSIVVVSLAERAGGYLFKLAKQIEEMSPRHTIMFYGEGQIVHGEKNDEFSIQGFPSTNDLKSAAATALTTWKAKGKSTGIFMSPDTAATVNEGRDATYFNVSTKDTSNGLAEVTNIEAEIKLRVGGPDKLVGYEQELQTLKDSIDPLNTRKKSQITLLKGQAGQGKSRLLAEATKGMNTITVSFDPARKNIPFYQLALFGEQVASAVIAHTPVLKEGLAALRSEIDATEDPATKGRKTARAEAAQRSLRRLEAIAQFSNLQTEEQKLRFAEEHTTELAENITSALTQLEAIGQPFALVIDDLHHIDTESDKHVMGIIRRFKETVEDSTVVLSMRPEEYAASPELRKLLDQYQHYYGEHAVTEIKVEGLDFGADLNKEQGSNAYQYIFHSLPVELRTNSEGGDRTLGTWWKELAQMAHSPLEMTNFIYTILEDKGNLQIDDTEINLTPGVLEKIELLSEGGRDIQVYHRNRIKALNKNEKHLLAAMGLMGRQTSIEDLEAIESLLETGGNSRDVMESLAGKGFLVESAADAQGRVSAYKIQHDTLRTAVLNTLSKGEQTKIAIRLFNHFRDDTSVPEQVKFNLLCYADETKVSNATYWRAFNTHARANFREAAERKEYARAYGIATAVLGETEGRSSKSSDSQIAKIVARLTNDDEIARLSRHISRPQPIHAGLLKLAITALQAKAESAYFIGKFDEAFAAADTLMKLANNDEVKALGEVDINLHPTLAAAFNSAYERRDTGMIGERLAAFKQGIDSKIPEFANRVSTMRTGAQREVVGSLPTMAIRHSGDEKGIEGYARKVEEMLNRAFEDEDLIAIRRAVTLVNKTLKANPGSGEAQLWNKVLPTIDAIAGGLAYAYGDTIKSLLEDGSAQSLEKAEMLVDRALYQLRADYKNAGKNIALLKSVHSQCKGYIDQNILLGANEEQKLLLERLDITLQLAIYLVQATEAKGFDDDMAFVPNHLEETEQAELMTLLVKLDDWIEKARGKVPDNQILFALENKAQLEALRGNYATSSDRDATQDSFREAWRLASRLGLQTVAMRVAKLQGDAQTMKGLVTVERHPSAEEPVGKVAERHTYDRAALVKALDIYKNQGLEPALEVDSEFFYQLALPIQVMRTIGLLAQSYIPEIEEARKQNDTASLTRISAELMPHLNLAIRGFNQVSAATHWKQPGWPEEIAYYMTSYMGYVLKAYANLYHHAQAQNIQPETFVNISDPRTSAYTSTNAIESAIQKLASMKDDELGELARKKEGLSTYLTTEALLLQESIRKLLNNDGAPTSEGPTQESPVLRATRARLEEIRRLQIQLTAQ